MNKLQQAWRKSFTDKRYRIGLHVIFWIIFLSLFQTIGFVIYSSANPEWHIQVWEFLGSLVGDVLLVCSIYYLTMVLSYRSIIIKKKYIQGLLYIIVCIIVYIHLFYFIEIIAFDLAEKSGHSLPPFAKSLVPYLNKGYLHFIAVPVLIFQLGVSYFLYMFLPVCCKFLRDQMRMQKSQVELQKKNIQLEMDFLKAQIHPHFLFNTLNNIYSLITQHENKKSAEMVSGLSSLLRYALYDGKTEFILLEKEVDMIKGFIGLEEVRADNMHLDLKFPSQIPSTKLPPFLLLPLVENAFKHGANSQLRDPCVKIEMEILEHHLWLQVKNCFDPEYRKKNSGGLGLLNLRKRLDYYYKGSYILETNEKNEIFTATLKLPVSCPVLNA